MVDNQYSTLMLRIEIQFSINAIAHQIYQFKTNSKSCCWRRWAVSKNL